MRLIFGQQLAKWALDRIPEMQGTGFGPCDCIGFANENGIAAVVVYHGYREKDGDIQISFATAGPKWATRGNIRAAFHYPFCQLGCRRVTCYTPKYNTASRKLLKGLGFELEGRIRFALNRHDHVLVYGMLKEECRWLKEPEHVQIRTVAARSA